MGNASQPVCAFAFALTLGLAGVQLGCLDPTQVTLEVTTDFDCIGPTTIEVAATPAFDGGVRTGCNGARRVGSLVFTRSADRFVVQITTPAPDGRPIVARRAVGFLLHTKLRLPVLMSASCAGVSCAPDLTCVRGSCVPDVVDPRSCQGAGCDETYLDGGATMMDAGLDSGKPDAGPSCPTVTNPALIASCPKSLEALPPFSQWHFDELTSATADPLGGNGPVQLGTGYSFGTDNTLMCGSQLQTGTVPGPLVLSSKKEFVTNPLSFSLFLRTTDQLGVVLQDNDGASGWRLETINGGLPDGGTQTLLQLALGKSGNWTVAIPPIDVTTTWHRVVGSIDASGAATLTVDGVKSITAANVYASPASSSLQIGDQQTFQGAIDELYFYCR